MPSSEKPELRRELGFGDALAVMLGVTIGAGIFAVPGRVAAYFPDFPSVAAAWLAATVFAFVGTMIYAELGARLPHTGGEYVYIHRAFGPLPAFVYGWSQLLVIRTNPAAALSLVFAEYAETFMPLGERGRLVLAVTVIGSLGLVNYFGLRTGKRVQAVTTILKVGGMLALVVGAALAVGNYAPNLGSTQVPRQNLGSLGNLSSAMLLTIFAFVGWDRPGYLAGEMKRPERQLPRAMLIGAAIAAFLYLSLVFLYHAAFPMASLSQSRVPSADLARVVWGPAGASFLALVVMVSTAGSTNGTIMASSRVYYAMARDGLFLDALARVHPRWRSPYVAVVAHCGWAVVLLLASRTVEALVGSLVFAALIFYGANTVAYFKFRREMGPAPFEAPGHPWLPALFLATVAAMTVATCYFHPRSALVNLALMTSGLPFYYFWRKRQ